MYFTPEARDRRYIDRWSIARVIRRQSLAEHMYFAALYADQIATLIGWKGNRASLLQYCLRHDCPEEITGDQPGPVKRAIGVETAKEAEFVKNMMVLRHGAAEYEMMVTSDPEVLAIRKVADLIDELHYLAEEMSLGNGTVRGVVMQNTVSRLRLACDMLPCDEITQRTVLDTACGNAHLAFSTTKVAIG